MKLTSQQIEIVRECAKDDDSFQRLLKVFGVENSNPVGSDDDVAKGAKPDLLPLDEQQMALLRMVIHALPVSAYVKNLESRMVIVNAATLAEHNLTDEAGLIGKNDFDLLDEALAQAHYDDEQGLMRTGQWLHDKETFAVNDDGSPVWTLITKAPIFDPLTGEVIGMIGINRNISERRLAEEGLKGERNLLQTIIDHIHDKIYIKDRKSRFIGANRATLIAQKTTWTELVGSTDFDYMWEERAQALFEEEQHIMETGEAVVNRDWYVPAKLTGDDPEWHLVTKVPVYDEHGECVGLVGVNRDITSRKLAQERTIELQLMQERSALLTDFVNDTSHEFLTPISVIKTASYMLSRIDDVTKQLVHIDRINGQVDRLTRLVEMLIQMSKLDATASIDTDFIHLGSVIETLLEGMEGRIEVKSLKVTADLSDELDLIRGDGDLLNVALTAILENAIRFTEEGGRITIRTRRIGDDVAIEISDTGIGMKTDVLPHIFKRLYREDSSHHTSGFGLGLPIAQRVVELHGGRIETESEPGVGSTFRVRLPYVEPSE